MNTSIRKFLAEEDGITALEYGILAALVAAILAVVFAPDGSLKSFFDAVFTKLNSYI
jgi:pilus assembly protein Flp/PilA